MTRRISLDAAEALAHAALEAHGFTRQAARATASALVLAERDGLASHGLSRLSFYLGQARSGKVDAAAEPVVEVRGAIVRVDARGGLAFPAIASGLHAVVDVAREYGLAAVAITRSHHFGVAGHPVERLARGGFVALAFANASASMAPWGGTRPLMGTNPIAFAAPREEGDPIVVDLSLSKVAKGKIMLAQKKGEAIPEGWALGPDGNPTTDPARAMAGTMIPSGDAKGAALALMVELLCAGLTGANFAWEASSLFDSEGPPPGLGHLVLVLHPDAFGTGFARRAEAMLRAVEGDEGARVPGARRFATRASRAEAIELSEELVAELEALGRRGDVMR